MDRRGAIAQALTPSFGELKARQPSLRENIAWAIANMVGGDRARQQWIADKAGGAVDFVPGVGEAIGVDEAKADYDAGNYGMAAAGLGATAAGILPVVGDIVSSAGKKALRMEGVRQALAERGPLFVRWSRGPEFDMKPGAVSKDYVTGQSHDGLSAIGIDADTPPSQLLRELRDYSFLRMKDPAIKPHIYAANRVGTDSDSAPTIRPSEFVGTLSDDLVRLMDDDSSIERLSLMERIDQNKRALEHYKQNPPKYLPIWTEETLRSLEKELADMGGPISGL